MWQAERTPVAEFVRVLGPGLPEIQPDLNDITTHVLNVLWDVPPGEQPLRPEGVAIMEQPHWMGSLFPDTDVLEYVCMENQRRFRPPTP